MVRFVDRHAELSELNSLLKYHITPFVMVYGRRRVGKTALLLHWVKQTGWPYLYWVARRETAEAVRESCARAIWRWAYPDYEDPEPPQFTSWEGLFERFKRLVAGKQLIIIFDEFSYAVESDPSLPSEVQVLWDHFLKDQPVVVLLSGSHIGMMMELVRSDAPLFGRFRGKLPIDPLPFAALSEFFPGYSAAERVAAYAVLGGVPAYLEQFDPGLSVSQNIRRHIFQSVGLFRSEPELLINDLVREGRYYETALRAIAQGAHTPTEMASIVGTAPANLMPYIKRLTELRLIERRVPALVPMDQRRTTTRSRYHLSDSYLRFYYRFVQPNLEFIDQGLGDRLLERISDQFRAFIGATAFEELCREWVLMQARARRLPMSPEIVGSHWEPGVQVDVVGVNWRDKAILLGECKWGTDAVGRGLFRELFDKTPKVVPDKDWQVHYVYFARAGFTDAARAEAKERNVCLVDLEQLDADLHKPEPVLGF